jgi:hypothetical protein
MPGNIQISFLLLLSSKEYHFSQQSGARLNPQHMAVRDNKENKKVNPHSPEESKAYKTVAITNHIKNVNTRT